MSDNVFVNADRTAVVDEASPGKKYQMRRKEAVRLGLLPDGDEKPQARRNVREDTSRLLGAPREDTVVEFSMTSSPDTKQNVKASAKRAAKK